MKLISRLLSLGLVLSIVMLGTSSAPAQRRRRTPKKPVAVPVSVSAIDAAGLAAVLKREAPNQKPLLVNFWATWCDPCREEFPDLVQIDKQFRERGLEFTAVSLDDLAEIKTSVPKFLREMRVTTPTYLLNVSDPELAMSQVDPQWSGALPATFLFDAQGNIAYKRLGRIQVPELVAAIEKVVTADR